VFGVDRIQTTNITINSIKIHITWNIRTFSRSSLLSSNPPDHPNRVDEVRSSNRLIMVEGEEWRWHFNKQCVQQVPI
jgi:hypothetical protein